MGFCTKCGQELIDGQQHICPAANNTPPVRPKPSTDNRSVDFKEEGDTIGVSIDKEAVKTKYNDFVSQVGDATNEVRNSLGNSFERGLDIVPDVINANDGEIPIKQYKIARLRTRITLSKAEGKLQVTNKRVIFRATGRSIMGKVTLHEEFKIDEIAGAEFRNRPEFNFFNFLIAIILTGLFATPGFLIANLCDGDRAPVFNGIITFFIVVFGILAIGAWIFLAIYLRKKKTYNRFYTLRLIVLSFIGGSVAQRAVGHVGYYSSDINKVTAVICAIILSVMVLIALLNIFLIAFVPNLVIKIKTKGALSGIEVMKEQPIALLGFLFGKNREESSGFLEVLPWVDTDIAIKEVGTMIDDIRTLGDAAIEKWKQ
ncbi:MAG: hypothetical protein E7570_02410 [Ruminococcaceae bacterium]|nr:hypothetical protein [Oscillospiraceae bacterium]